MIQVNSMKEKQLSNLQDGFKILMKTLQEKRVELTQKLTQKYDNEILEMNRIKEPLIEKEK